MPVTEPKMPVADSVIGKITGNEDPLGQGRVQVDFAFANQYSRIWMRVLSPNAGSSNEVSHNRGFMFVPEVGDQVMIGFEYGDPNRPYVMGSLFHGKNGKGGQQNNQIKSIITRSGIKVVFNDDAKSLHIEDPSGNTWNMDGNGNITVSAPNQINFNADHIVLNAGKTITSNAGDTIVFNSGNLITSKSEMLSQFANNLWSVQSNTTLLNTVNKLNIESPEMILASSQRMTLHSDNALVANSLNSIEMKAKNSLQSTQESEEYDYSQQIDTCIVDFRPDNNFDLSYGFDWFREGDFGDNAFERNLVFAKTNTLKKGSNRFYEILTKEEALKALSQKEYKDSYPIVGSDKKYHVPILNIYSQGALHSFADLPSDRRPVNVAKLSILVTINKKISKLYFTYDKSLFTLSNETLQESEPTAKRWSHDSYLTITCKDSSEGFTSAQYITAWATVDDNTPPILAGQLKISPNAPQFRKKHKVLVLRVKTNIRGKELSGEYEATEINNIYKFLYQAFVEVELTEYEGMFDLTDDVNFKIRHNGKKEVYGKYIFQKDKDPLYGQSSDDLNDGGIYQDYMENGARTIYSYLRKKFLNRPGNDVYKDHTILYVFGDNSYQYSIQKVTTTEGEVIEGPVYTAGQTENFGSQNVIIFWGTSGTMTMAHELLHSMGLYHTFHHRPEGNNKYSFLQGSTDNIMDYDNMPKHTYSWQWKIINEKLR